MMYSTVLFLVALSAGKSTAMKTCCKNSTLDPDALRSVYKNALNGIMVPTLEVGDVSAGIFKNISGNTIGEYGIALVSNLHTQAWVAGNKLIHDAYERYYSVKRAISLLNKYDTKPNCLDSAIQNLTKQIEKFLKLKPGISEFEPPVMPLVAEQQIEVISRTENRTPEDIFLNNELTILAICRQVYAYLTYLFIISVRDFGPAGYAIIRTAFYDEILNCPVLGNYTKIVTEVLEKRHFIYRHVKPATWKSFKNATDQVIAVSKAYCSLSKYDKSSEQREEE